MTRWIPLVLFALTPVLGANMAQAGPRFMSMDSVQYINWDGAVSHGNMHVYGLPAVQLRAVQARRKTTRRRHRPVRIEKRTDQTTPLLAKRARHRPRPIRKRIDKSTPLLAGLPGPRRPQQVRVTKPVDKVSRLLREVQANGRILPYVEIRGRDRFGRYYRVILRDVRITSYNVSGSGQTATEQISFVYQKIEWT